jgi:hypothetical protein
LQESLVHKNNAQSRFVTFFLLGMPCCRQHPARPLLQAKAEPMKASSEIARTAARSFLYNYPAGPSKNEKVEQFYQVYNVKDFFDCQRLPAGNREAGMVSLTS